jgi:hypothetical protein
MPDTISRFAPPAEVEERRLARDVVARYGPRDDLRLRRRETIHGRSFPAGSPVRVASHRAFSFSEQYEVEVTDPDGHTGMLNLSEQALDHMAERYLNLRGPNQNFGQTLQSLKNAAVRTPVVLPVREPEAKPGRTAWEWLDEDSV